MPRGGATIPATSPQSGRTSKGVFEHVVGAGEYLAAALDYVADGDANNPAFLEKLKERATTFTLAEGAREAVNLVTALEALSQARRSLLTPLTLW